MIVGTPPDGAAWVCPDGHHVPARSVLSVDDDHNAPVCTATGSCDRCDAHAVALVAVCVRCPVPVGRDGCGPYVCRR